ncbi:MAG TPA: hypothetical protein VN520_31790 [Streptomyces sp.]|uniref:hypothetical protein n=1 Tax=Streptomyces sp. TaxID=1931 RepID=UPI002C8D7EC6|nr:hypothetical protein [Streptomyces sp.]HWU10884.1 hypothetical protein [Streptomyces sp.]
MVDLLLTLAVPAAPTASGAYAVCDRRRQRRGPPLPHTHRAARLTAHDALVLAETVADHAYTALARLYTDPAAPRPVENTENTENTMDVDNTEKAGKADKAESMEHTTAVSRGTDASPDHGPSRPAPARRP